MTTYTFTYGGEAGFKDFDLALNKVIPTSTVLSPGDSFTYTSTSTDDLLVRRVKISNNWTVTESTSSSSGSGSSGSGGS